MCGELGRVRESRRRTSVLHYCLPLLHHCVSVLHQCVSLRQHLLLKPLEVFGGARGHVGVSWVPGWSLDVLSELDAKVFFAKLGILLADLVHSFFLRLFHVLLVAFVVVVVGGTFASQGGGSGGWRAVSEMIVSFLGDVFTTVVANGAAARAHDLVASAVFED